MTPEGMTPEQLGAYVAARVPGASYTISYGELTVDVPAEAWADAASIARDDERIACTFFDWLSAVDERERGCAVVVHLYSPAHRHHLRLRATVGNEQPAVPTLTAVFAGADWHERETAEMFGIDFAGHPGLTPLLLPDGFEGHPLRKEFVLASRVAKSWPGAVEPGESVAESVSRRPNLPPGVPEPGTWPAQEVGE